MQVEIKHFVHHILFFLFVLSPDILNCIFAALKKLSVGLVHASQINLAARIFSGKKKKLPETKITPHTEFTSCMLVKSGSKAPSVKAATAFQMRIRLSL